MDGELLEKVRLSLPPYLAAADKQALLDQLSGHDPRPDYYGPVDDPEPVQGDGWRGLIGFDFASGEREQQQGLILSNSCDIAAANEPYPDQHIAFSPILSLSRYERFLIDAGISRQQVDDLVGRMRQQKVHRIFYLPAMEGIREECIVALDIVHSQPLDSLPEDAVQRQFSLSLFGWYMLLLKLSIHFTRMSEAVERASVVRR